MTKGYIKINILVGNPISEDLADLGVEQDVEYRSCFIKSSEISSFYDSDSYGAMINMIGGEQYTTDINSDKLIELL